MTHTARRTAVLVGLLAGAWLLAHDVAAAATHTYWNTNAEYWRTAGNWTAGVPTAATNAHVNNGGTAITDQVGAACNRLYIGEDVGESGTVWMTAGDLSAEIVHVGLRGDGAFAHTDGDLKIADDLYVGYYPGSTGTYSFWAGSIEAARIDIGSDGNGEFTYQGGTFGRTTIQIEDHGTFTAHADWHHDGGLDILGGTLDMDTHTLRLGGVTHTAGYEMLVGLYSGTVQAHEERLGYDDWPAADATVRFHQNGGTHNVAERLAIGCGGYGEYWLSNGDLHADYVSIGYRNENGRTGEGHFRQTGGTHTVDGYLSVGRFTQGSYDLEDGTLTARHEVVGGPSLTTSEFLQTGGTHTVAEHLTVGTSGPAVFTLQGGTLDVGTDIRSDSGAGTFVLDGGTLTVGTGVNVPTFTLGQEAGRTGEFTLLPGRTMTGEAVVVGDQGTGVLNLAGGTYEVATTTVGADGTVHGTADLTCPGAFDIQGGTVDFAGHEFVLNAPDASMPTSTLASGSLSAGDAYIGRWGRRHKFIQTGGTVTVTGDLHVYDGGRYELRAGAGHLSTGGTHIGLPVGDSIFIQLGGTHTVNGALDVGGDGGRYELREGAGVLTVANQEYIGYYGDGTFWQQGGTHTIGNRLNVGFSGGPGDPPHGTFELLGGTLVAPEQQVGGTFGTGEFVQSGGSNTADLGVFIGMNQDGAYTLSDGSLQAGALYVGLNGQLHLTGAGADVRVSNELFMSNGTVFTAVPGATVHMTGASFYQSSTSPADMAGLENLHVIFEGGPGDNDPFEVAGRDKGARWSGWDNNFALDTLGLGGADVGRLRLRDTTDNRPGWDGTEALYVRHLTVGPASVLDLNGCNLYYMTSEIDPAAVIEGGSPTCVPGLMPDVDIQVIGPKQIAYVIRLTAFDMPFAAKMVSVTCSGQMSQVKQQSGDDTPTLSRLQPLTPEERTADTHFLLYDEDLHIVEIREDASELVGQFEVFDKVLAQDLPLARIVAEMGQEIRLVGQVGTASGQVIPLDIVVPEPAALALLAAGALGLLAFRRPAR
jgi:hypothetical protein